MRFFPSSLDLGEELRPAFLLLSCWSFPFQSVSVECAGEPCIAIDNHYSLDVIMLPLEGRSETIFIVTTIFLGISFIAVCLRCFVRIKIVRAFGWDDALMVFAMVRISPPLNDEQWGAVFADNKSGLEHSVCPVRDHWRSIRNGSKVQGTHGTTDYGNCHVCTFSGICMIQPPQATVPVRLEVHVSTNHS